MSFLGRQTSARAGFWGEGSGEDGDEQRRWVPRGAGSPPLLWCRTMSSALAL